MPSVILNENDEEQKFDITPEQATSGLKPSVFNRKKLLVVLCVSFAVIVCGGLILNTISSSSKKNSASDEQEYSIRQTSSNEFINGLQRRAVSRRITEENQSGIPFIPEDNNTHEDEIESLLPAASFVSQQVTPQPVYNNSPAQYQHPQNAPSSQRSQDQETHYRSSLVPEIQGSLFSNNSQSIPVRQNSGYSSPAEEYFSNAASRYSNPVSNNSQQNNQPSNQSFYDASSGGTIYNGAYLGENTLWIGTVIPAVLETSINTDLPGNVLARVTQNIYDSQTGKKLLIPQGTLLLARYNSSISYAQSRVQIVWDIMIRPDGFQIDLEGANAVDKSGMSGQMAKYDENWFEYIKAAGIITLFSVANARITESAAKHASDSSAANIAEANFQLVNQLGGNLVSRAMNIQPTLTVDNGTVINIMLNKNLYLPPVSGFPAVQKYILE